MNALFLKARSPVIFLPLLMVSAPAVAEEKGLIWAPKKISDTSYSARLGMRLPVERKVEGGIEVGLAASQKDIVAETPVRLWGDFNLETIQTPAGAQSRNVGVVVNALTGNMSVKITRTERRIVTSTIDVETARAILLRYDRSTDSWHELDVNQTIRLDRKESGTAVFIKATGTGSFGNFAASTGLEQKIGDNLTLSGAMEQRDNTTTGKVNARYSIRW